MGLDVHRPANDGRNRSLDALVIQFGAIVDLQVQGVFIPVVEDISGHSVLGLDDDAALVALDDLAQMERYALGTRQPPQLLAVHIHHAFQVGYRHAERGPHEQAAIGMISKPHRGHASAQFNVNLPKFFVLDVTFHRLLPDELNNHNNNEQQTTTIIKII